MPDLGVSIDPREITPDTGRPEPFPDGVYRFMVLNTDVRSTKKGDGSLLVVDHEVQGGEYAGRRWFSQITLDNPSQQAVAIGQRQISALLHSVGYMKVLTNSDALHGLVGEAEVGIEGESHDIHAGKTYAAKNVTRRYIILETAAGGNGAARQSKPDQAAPQPPMSQGKAASGKARPW